MKKHSLQIKKYLSFFLAFALMASSLTYYISADDSESGEDEKIVYEGDALNGWELDIFWSNGQKSITIDANRNQEYDIKAYGFILCSDRCYDKGLSAGHHQL